jgi:O-methyltransferase
MFRKIINLLSALIGRKIAIDYTALGLQRNRLFPIPQFTNYIRISSFELIVQEINEKKLIGAVAEVGVYKGEFAKYINLGFADKKFYLFDTFEGFHENDVKIENSKNLSKGSQDFSNTSVDVVLNKMPNRENCIIKKGYFPDSLDGLEEVFCFVSLDPDLYKPILDGLEYFYPRLVEGGYIFVHDYNNDLYPGAKKAVREFCDRHRVPFVPIADSWGTVVLTK